MTEVLSAPPIPATRSSLEEKLAALMAQVTGGEREHLRMMLCYAACDLPASKGGIANPAFAAVVRTLAEPGSAGPVAYRGFPSFVTPALMSELLEEATALRPHAVRNNGYSLAFGGEAGERLGHSEELRLLLGDSVVGRTASGARYLYYDQEGDGVEPHVDNVAFSFNAILMLQQRFVTEPSYLLLFKDADKPERIVMRHGEMVAFNAGAVVHGRERIKSGDSVTLITLGFQ